MLPFSFIGMWTYTNPATVVAVNIPMTDKPDWVFVKDTTNWGAQSTAANPIYAEWFSSMAAGSFLALGQPSSTTTGVTTYASQGTSGGFTFIDQTNPPTFTKVAVTAVNGTTFVVSTGNTAGLAVGDLVRLINITGAQEISGSNLYQITAISANTSITLGYAASAVTAGLVIANGTTGFYQKVFPTQFLPNTLPVAFITQATQAVVYFFRQNPYTPGELVDFQIPTPYGMTQLSNLTGKSGSGPFTSNPAGAARVLSVTNSSTVSSITIDVDTTGFTAFQYPTSANFAGGASPAVCIPAGSGVVPLNGSATIPASPPGTNLADAFDNKSQFVMNIGTSAAGVANANMVVMAFKADFVNGITNA
jgi:hypothetical protein